PTAVVAISRVAFSHSILPKGPPRGVQRAMHYIRSTPNRVTSSFSKLCDNGTSYGKHKPTTTRALGPGMKVGLTCDHIPTSLTTPGERSSAYVELRNILYPFSHLSRWATQIRTSDAYV